MKEEYLNCQHWKDLDEELYEGQYMGIPKIKGMRMKSLDNLELVGFNFASNEKTENRKDKIVHFYLPDGRFEQVWNAPFRYIPLFQQYKAIIEPDFSMFVEMPWAMQIWNKYRNQWLARFYQEYGIRVIPNLRFGFEETYELAFTGIPKHACVAISSVGLLNRPINRELLINGFKAAVDIVEPEQVIWYGREIEGARKIYPDIVVVQDYMSARRDSNFGNPIE